MDLTKSERTGTNAQLVNVIPDTRGTVRGQTCRSGPAHARSLEHCSPSSYGVGIFGLYQLYKKTRIHNQDNLSIRSQVWCCVDFTWR